MLSGGGVFARFSPLFLPLLLPVTSALMTEFADNDGRRVQRPRSLWLSVRARGARKSDHAPSFPGLFPSEIEFGDPLCGRESTPSDIALLLGCA